MGHLAVTIGIAGAAGIAGYILADRLRIPGILLYLVLGILLGPAGLAIVPVDALHKALPIAVPLAAAVILFDGGLGLDFAALRACGRGLRNLILVGGLVSLVGGTLVGWLVAGLPFGVAAIFGSLMIVTGPTVILPILKRVPLVERVRTMLQGEAILIDPIGVVVAVVVAEYVVLRASAGALPVLRLAMQVGIGIASGAIAGLAAGFLLRMKYFASAARRDSANLLALGAALASYAAAEAIVEEGGIISVTVAGLVLSMFHLRVLRAVRHFKEQLTTFLVATLFVLISASIDPRLALRAGWRLWATVALVALVLRPAGVLLSTWKGKMTLREKLFVAWIGPRGIIAAAVASLSAIELRRHDLPGGQFLEVLVFAIIGSTVLVQGLTAGLVARLLGVRAEHPALLVIGGAHALGRALARAVVAAGAPVRLIDSSALRCTRARSEGLDVQEGSLGDPDSIERACQGAGAFVALTAYTELNSLASLLARQAVGVANSYRVRIAAPDGAPRLGEFDPDDRPAFLEPLDVEVVIDAVADGVSEIANWPVEQDGRLGAQVLFVGGQPLVIVRNRAAIVAKPGLQVFKGDQCILLRAGVVPLESPDPPRADLATQSGSAV